MKWRFAVLAVVFAVLGISTATANAQTITWGNGTPKGGVNTIGAAGTFDCGVGNTLYGVELRATSTTTLKLYKSLLYSATPPPQTGSWNCVVNSVPAGDYNVEAKLLYKNALGTILSTTFQAPNNPYTVTGP